jgi:hypothetical protein
MKNKNFLKYYFEVDFETQIEAAGLDLEGPFVHTWKAHVPWVPGSGAES